MSCNIPIMPPMWKREVRETPITPRENLMRAFNHEKPMWMPTLYADSQLIMCKSNHDMMADKTMAGQDWFGTNYILCEHDGINMPHGGVFDCVTEWREKVKWPDLDAIDWSKDAEGFVRDESKALYTRFSNGLFERLHAFESFEQCLVDIVTEPEACRDLFERLADYKIDLFNHIRDVFPLDYLVAADDYGTAHAPFFSTALFEDLLLEPTKRFVRAVQARGTRFFAHCCGKIEPFMPYFANELGVDGVEIQDINNIPKLMQAYGDRLVFEVHSDPRIMFDDATTDEQVLTHVRDIVDTLGAQSNPGSGAVLALSARTQSQFTIADNEFYSYSLAKYAPLQK